jgi:hypothetical protein
MLQGVMEIFVLKMFYGNIEFPGLKFQLTLKLANWNKYVAVFSTHFNAFVFWKKRFLLQSLTRAKQD